MSSNLPHRAQCTPAEPGVGRDAWHTYVSISILLLLPVSLGHHARLNFFKAPERERERAPPESSLLIEPTSNNMVSVILKYHEKYDVVIKDFLL